MSVEQLTYLAQIRERALPSCAFDCIWFETGNHDGECLNRHTFICHFHRDEVFGNADNFEKELS
ncbi:MAG: hypothetical protein V1816_16200 [Pseudomonadota bacterium]